MRKTKPYDLSFVTQDTVDTAAKYRLFYLVCCQSKQYGPFSSKDEHHSGLPRGLRGWARFLASRRVEETRQDWPAWRVRFASVSVCSCSNHSYTLLTHRFLRNSKAPFASVTVRVLYVDDLYAAQVAFDLVRDMRFQAKNILGLGVLREEIRREKGVVA